MFTHHAGFIRFLREVSMVRYPVCVVVGALLLFLIGCSGFDSTQVLVHPDTITTSSTFDVVLVDVFMQLDSNTTISNKVERDSLHLLVGMPASWNVVSAQFVVIRDMKNEQMLALQNDTLDEQAVAALVQKYQAQATALPADALLSSAIAGKTINAHDLSNEEEVAVDVGKVAAWKGFGAPVNIVLEKGSKPDTVVSIDSAVAFFTQSDTAGSDSIKAQIELGKALGLVPDSIGISIVPIALLLKIQAGPAEGTDTLYYFTKTGEMNQEPNQMLSAIPEMADLETGDMAFVPIKVISAAGVINGRLPFNSSAVSAVSDLSTGTVRIDMGNMGRQQASVGIYSLQGNLVRTLTPAAFANSIVWNGADERGNKVRSGSYLLRIAGTTGSVVRNVQLVR